MRARKHESLSASARELIFGQPPIMVGEDRRAYQELHRKITSALKPVDFIDEICIRDITDLTWEISRLRRFKKSVLDKDFPEHLERLIRNSLPARRVKSDEGKEKKTEEKPPLLLQWTPDTTVPSRIPSQLVKNWLRKDPAAVQRVDTILSSKNMSVDTARASAFLERCDDLDRIQQCITHSERRRDSVLHELARRRRTSGRNLSQNILDIEDLDYEVIG